MINEEFESTAKCDKQTEFRLLGALIYYGNWWNREVQEAFGLLEEHHFYYPDTKNLFLYLKHLYEKKQMFGLPVLESILPLPLRDVYLDVLGEGYLGGNTLQHDLAKLDLLKTLRPQMRTLTLLLEQLKRLPNPMDCKYLLAKAMGDIAKMHTANNREYCMDYESLIDKVLSDDDVKTEINLNLQTWPTLPANSMLTIAGRSGAGKTLLGIWLMDEILKVSPNTQALYFNLEMQQETMLLRHANMLSVTQGSLKERIKKTAHLLMERDVQLITRPLITIEEIEMVARARSLVKPISVIVVDYIGLVRTRTKHERKDLEQGDIAQRLAALGLDLKCNVIVLLQVNRDYKNRAVGNRCPETSDAAESTGCERSSSLWMGIELPQKDSDEAQFKDLFIIKNRKSRGEQGHFTIYMDFKDGRFYERNQKTVLLAIPEANTLQSLWDKKSRTDLG